MRHELPKHAATLAAIALCVGAAYLVLPRRSETSAADEGFDDLAACSFLTSIDSRRSLYLAASHTARLSEKSGAGLHWASGTWRLLDDDAHLYAVEIGGESRVYTLVSAPEGEGCMLAAGSLGHADLNTSWFSTLTAPK